jgi:S1-C subfamily serine protease
MRFTYNYWRYLAASTLAIMLAGCSGNDAAGLLNSTAAVPTQAAASVPAARPVTETPAGELATAVSIATPTPAAAAQPVSQPADPGLEDARQQIAAEERIVADVFARVGPSVVRIETSQGLGSGWLIDAEGHVITNNHVIADSANGRVNVAFTGLFETVGEVVGTDPDSDIAVVKVEELPEGASPVEMGDSDAVRVGQRTIAIGNPLGQDRTVTTGIVSAIGRTIEEDPRYNYSIGGAIQTDAAINPGNSGGPLLNTLGQVIGMNTAILSQSGTSSGIGFSVPVNLIKKVSRSLIEQGKYEHPYLGVSLGDVTTLDARENNLPSAGVLIQPGDNSGPVAQAGLNGRAILVAIDDVPVTSSDEVIAYLELKTQPGDTVKLSLVGSNGQTQDLSVQLAARPNVADREQP